MSNINRDYLIVLNPKTSKVTVPELNYYIYDKYTANLFVNLVTTEAGKVVNLPDADQYKLVLHVLKPTNEIQDVENIQVFNKEKALFQIELDHELTKNIGRYKCELLTIDKTDHIVQSAKFSYRVKKSIYNDLDVVTETPQYPIIINLLNKLQDIDKYEEERRANEVARVAAEKARVEDYTDLRQTVTTDIETMQEKIDSFDGKVQEVDNAVQQMRTNITDYQTEKNKELDNYKTQKDAQINTAITDMENTIDTYKTEKDTQINDKITQQDNKIDSAINLQNKNIQASTKALNDKLDAAVEDQNNTIEANNQAQNKVINDAITEQNKTINTVVENDKAQDGKLDALGQYSATCMKDIKKLQNKDVAHEERMTAIEAVNVEQNNRLDAIEIKNDQQDSRLNDVEAKNKKQDLDLKCLFAESHSERITLDDEVGNSVFLQNSKQGFATVDELKGNTLVNCNKDTDKELILNGNIDTSGYGTVTTTEGVDGGKVDISLEGNTMVNVCDQEEAVAITKSYTVETGNHIALQGEYDGKCRPNVYGNTLVSWQQSNALKGQQITINKQYQTNGIDTLNTTVGDKVYFRIKFTVDELNTTSPDPKIFTKYNSGYMVDVKQFKDCTVGKIEEASTIREHESAHADQPYMKLCIGMYAIMPEDVPAGSPVCKYTIHDYVIYNLTQLFGAGKEPQQEWCDKNLPYLEGMKSSFEDKLITDENDANNGKYKVDYKVTGKNLFNVNAFTQDIKNNKYYQKVSDTSFNITALDDRSWNPYQFAYGIRVKKNTKYTISGTIELSNIRIVFPSISASKMPSSPTFDTGNDNIIYLKFIETNSLPKLVSNIQLEEGTTATDYEPYKEYIKTLYLNSPLLEGDTIEQSGNNIIHNHRYTSVVLDGSDDEGWSIIQGEYAPSNTDYTIFYMENNCKLSGTIYCDKIPTSTDKYITGSNANSCAIGSHTSVKSIRISIEKSKLSTQDVTGFKQWLQQNPITVVYELETPTQEIISANDNLLLDSYTNGHLDVDTIVPIDKVEFAQLEKELTYLNASTEYTIQFISDKAITVDITLGGKQVLAQNITAGLNKINITTTDTLADNKLIISGVGAEIKQIVVTPKVDGEFGYFKGMKSVGECEGNKIEVVAQNKNLFTSEVIDALCTLENWVGNGAYKNNYVAYKLMNFKTGVTYTNTIPSIKVPPNFYPILFLDHIGNGNFLSSGWYENNTDNEKTVSGNTYTFTVKKDTCFVAYVYNWNEENMQKLRKVLEQNIQTEIGKTSTEFVESKLNKQTLTHEPLRGLPNGVKDKYVIIDGKWYIERNTYQTKFNTSNYLIMGISTSTWHNGYQGIYATAKNTSIPAIINTTVPGAIISDKLPNKLSIYTNDAGDVEGIGTWSDSSADIIGRFKVNTTKPNNEQTYSYINALDLNIIYQLAQPTYEPIEYNPFEVYTDTTHISNNSNIPCNMVIRNSGFNCILKPNTTYTVSSNNGLSTVTTKDSIGDSVLRFYDKDTTSITKMSNVLVLEGDYVTGNPPIPAFFEGMESVFEQELVTDEKDKNYGKYKVNVKAVGKNLFNKDTVIKGKYQNCNTNTNDFTIANHSNYSISDFVPVKPNTQYTISGTDIKYHAYYDRNKEPITTTGTTNTSFTTLSNAYYMIFNLNSTDDLSKIQIEQGTKATEYEPYKENNITFYINEPLRGVNNIKDKVYVKEDKVVVERNCSSITVNGSEKDWVLMKDNGNSITFRLHNDLVTNAGISSYCISNLFVQNMTSGLIKADNSIRITEFSGIQRLFLVPTKDKCFDLQSFKQWLQQNPTTVVYQLATPIYEEVEYFDLKLFVEIFKDTTINYNSNIPVTSTINYTYSTPLTDAVNTVSDISDQQDSMIIDMATQVATMEMMLM